MRLAVPDLISNSYFPAIAAVELGFMADEGLDVTIELVFPVTDAARRLANGEFDLLAGAAHSPLYVEPRWGSVQLVAALSQNMYWFLVVRTDSAVGRDGGDPLAELAGQGPMRIGAAPGPDLGLRQLLIEAGLDVENSKIEIAPVPGADSDSVSFGVTAAQALEDGRIDAFWANGMGAEVATARGVGRVVFDARRAGGAQAGFTFPALMATRRMIDEQTDAVAAAVRAIVRTQQALTQDSGLARRVGTALFPEMEAELIAGIVERDLPFYDAHIEPAAVAGINRFAAAAGLTDGDPGGYDRAVASRFAALWTT